MDALLLSSKQYDRVLEGVTITVQLLGSSFALGVALSLVFGVARLSTRRSVRGAALVYVEFARGISTIVLLFVMAYAIPILLGLDQSNVFWLATLALGVNMGGYGAEIIRGAILSVPRGQTEASIALNLTKTQRLRFVVLPQALRVILPPMGNLTIEILKGTALVSLVGMSDLTFEIDKLNTNRVLASEPVDTSILYLNALIFYFVLAQAINLAFRLAERWVERKYEGDSDMPTPDEPAAIGAAK
ncbi:amino acid ABC transporter permease [Actinospongicola halichondriae]|uniref:amino acid ABC transporter permease n=1 Tax=Actinospongicola halichondriae TaxID=3236844 RepID=UPI003D50B054